ncbi:glycosyl transferase family 8 [Klebsormidium nitens]|uniref:Glycosyl transferase family 8 n=1 Tax=Klebsormidium nitens TaxID=105231 RepID=A0A1Y1I6V9_KLENI|nr:glycosyl transferase family 8 [Klebsormidium nitens]|eukprot:GAQ84466.1 glycosyl transferase family 8 [Klebsormidium nitens]
MGAGRRDRGSWSLSAAMTSALVLVLVGATSAVAHGSAGSKQSVATGAEEGAVYPGSRNAEPDFAEVEGKLARASLLGVAQGERKEVAHAGEGFARHPFSSRSLGSGSEGLGRTVEESAQNAEDVAREQGPGGKLRGVHGDFANARKDIVHVECEKSSECSNATVGHERKYEKDEKAGVLRENLELPSVIVEKEEAVLAKETRAKGCGRGDFVGASKPAARGESGAEVTSSAWQMLPLFGWMYRFSSQRQERESADVRNEKQVSESHLKKADSRATSVLEQHGRDKRVLGNALKGGQQTRRCVGGGNRTAEVAFSTILYVDTSRDYEYFVATRVMIQSLLWTGTDADVVVLASEGVPQDWIDTLESEGARVLSVADVPNPYRGRAGVQPRFARALNKLLAWRLTEYARVVQLDADNLFLRNVDELFACGDFCAVFINPCIFHTGLMVLKPSLETYADMLKQLETAPSFDGADQGFLASYFPDLLDCPMFRPLPPGSARLNGTYRLPLGYQMDHVYYYLNFRWTLTPACAPQGVLTFPGAPVLKPWYWWSWPLLPLTLEWHKRRAETIGYEPELYRALLLATAWFVLGISVVSISQRTSARGSHRPRSPPGSNLGLPLSLPRSSSPPPKSTSTLSRLFLGVKTRLRFSPPLRATAIYLSLGGSAVLAFWAVPTTVHPFLGWALFYLGSMSLVTIILSVNPGLPVTALAAPWLLWAGVLGVLAAPIYSAGAQKIVALCLLSAAAAAVLLESGRRILATCKTEEAEWKAQHEAGVVRWGQPEKEN